MYQSAIVQDHVKTENLRTTVPSTGLLPIWLALVLALSVSNLTPQHPARVKIQLKTSAKLSQVLITCLLSNSAIIWFSHSNKLIAQQELDFCLVEQ